MKAQPGNLPADNGQPVERRRDPARREAYARRDWSKQGDARWETKSTAKLETAQTASVRFI
jgi:hypothetical protein|nr:hypothetical protein [uncultured Roseateles sp.]